MQVQQVFFRTGTPISADEARGMVSRLSQQVDIPRLETVMNNQDDPVRSSSGFPWVHFAASKDGFSMLAYGNTGSEALIAAAQAIHMKLSSDLKQIVQLNQRTLTLGAEIGYRRTYRIPRMVVVKKPVHKKFLNDPVQGKEHLERLFRDSILRQASAIGINIPQNFSVNFIGAEATFMAKSKRESSDAGQDIFHLGLKNAQFETDLHLKGIWAVGYMLSKGYGHFNPDFMPKEGGQA